MTEANRATLDVSRLRLLREVALRGSIAAAARAMGLTASAVSQQLAVLEREAGTDLLDRTPRGVRLTGAGHALVDRAASILALLEQARGDLDRLTGELAGPVRVGTVASAAAALVGPAASVLARRHPEVRVAVTVAEPAASLDALLAADLDIAVVDVYDGVPLAIPEPLTAAVLCAEPLVAVLPTDHRQVGAKRVDLADLADEDWVMPPIEAACGQAVRVACRALGFEPRLRWETDDMLVLVRAVAQGHGVAVLPRLAVADDVAAVAIRPIEPAMTRQLLAVTRASSGQRPVVRAVLDALIATAP